MGGETITLANKGRTGIVKDLPASHISAVKPRKEAAYDVGSGTDVGAGIEEPAIVCSRGCLSAAGSIR